MSTTLTAAPSKLSAADLATAQQAHHYFAFDGDYSDRQLERMRRVYATKRQELNAFNDIIELGQPDLILRTPNGRQLVIRLENSHFFGVYSALRDALSEGLKDYESEIVGHVRTMEED